MGQHKSKRVEQDAFLVLIGNAAFDMHQQITKEMVKENTVIGIPARLAIGMVEALHITLKRLDSLGAIDLQGGQQLLNSVLEEQDGNTTPQ